MAHVVEAELTLRIPRDGERDLRDEARARLVETAVVERVDAFDVTGVRPRLNDLQVTASATMACTEPERGPETRDALADAVGIEAVDRFDHRSTR